MLALALNWLALAILGAGYLCWRLPKDWRSARYRVRIRVMGLRMQQSFRELSREYEAVCKRWP